MIRVTYIVKGKGELRRFAVGIGILVFMLLVFPSYVIPAYAEEPPFIEILNYLGFTNVTETARITVASVSVGGYSVSLSKSFSELTLVNYSIVIALFGVALSLLRRKKE